MIKLFALFMTTVLMTVSAYAKSKLDLDSFMGIKFGEKKKGTEKSVTYKLNKPFRAFDRATVLYSHYDRSMSVVLKHECRTGGQQLRKETDVLRKLISEKYGVELKSYSNSDSNNREDYQSIIYEYEDKDLKINIRGFGNKPEKIGWKETRRTVLETSLEVTVTNMRIYTEDYNRWTYVLDANTDAEMLR